MMVQESSDVITTHRMTPEPLKTTPNPILSGGEGGGGGDRVQRSQRQFITVGAPLSLPPSAGGARGKFWRPVQWIHVYMMMLIALTT